MDLILDYLPIIWVALGVGLLLYLNIVVKLNSVLALLIVSILVGILNGYYFSSTCYFNCR